MVQRWYRGSFEADVTKILWRKRRSGWYKIVETNLESNGIK